jgi:hypothetical protein
LLFVLVVLVVVRATDNKTRENIVLAMQHKEKRSSISMWLNVSLSTVDKVGASSKKQEHTCPYHTQDAKTPSPLSKTDKSKQK